MATNLLLKQLSFKLKSPFAYLVYLLCLVYLHIWFFCFMWSPCLKVLLFIGKPFFTVPATLFTKSFLFYISFHANNFIFKWLQLNSNPVAVTNTSDFVPASNKEFLDIQATIESGFTLKRIRDMTTYSQFYFSLTLSTSLSLLLLTSLVWWLSWICTLSCLEISHFSSLSWAKLMLSDLICLVYET